jgi:tetratricopeptide (TPR) repeat protein
VNSAPALEPSSRADRLESWKEIAAYLRRSERTVRRWEEAEGLPVHRLRHEKRGSVYAYASELDAWRQSRQQLLSAVPDERAPLPSSVRSRRVWVVGSVAVVFAVGATLWLAWQQATPAVRSTNPDAWRAFQQAEFAGNAGRVQIASGIRNYEEAIRLDPGFARAWSGLAIAHVAQTFFDERPATETLAAARREAQRAAQLDPSLVTPKPVLAAVSHFLDWDHVGAEQQFRESVALAPDLAVAHSWFSELLLDLRRFDEAAATVRRAQQAQPRWLEPIVVGGNIHMFTGHVDLAIAEYQRALATEPSFGLANHFLGRAYVVRGDHDRAVQQLRKSSDLLGEVPFSTGDLGYALGAAGARAEAERLLADVHAKRAKGFYPAFVLAQIHMGLGQHTEALNWLERAADERQVGYYMPSVDPIYDPVRSHPRFQTLLRRMRLDDAARTGSK